MATLKFKDPVTGEVRTVGFPGGNGETAGEADYLTVTDFGDMGGKTIADLRAALDNWLTDCGTDVGVGQFSVHKSFINMWDAEDTATALEHGGRWTCTIIGAYVNPAYVRLMVTSYSADGVYIFTKQNGVWKPTETLITDKFSGELIIDGNIKGKYMIGTWLQGTADNHLDSAAGKIVVQDEDGWLYHRTPEEILSDIGAGTGSGDASAQIAEHNTDETAHADIRSVIKEYQKRGTVSGTSIKTWTEAQTVSTCIAVDTTVTDMPYANGYWVIDLDISANGNWKMLTATQAGNADRIYVRQSINGTWSEWMNVAVGSFLPLTGGTLSNTLSFERSGLTASLIPNSTNKEFLLRVLSTGSASRRDFVIQTYEQNATNKSALRFYENINGTGTLYSVLHTGNKPTGTYTGDNTTSRTIQTGGIGSLCMVWRTGSINVLLVTPNGVIAGYGEDGVQHKEDVATFLNGILTIKSNSAIINASGTTYNYQVL